MEIEDLQLSVRCQNILKDLGIKDVAELIRYTPGNLANARGWGRKCLLELREKLLTYGLCLAGDTIVSSKQGIELIEEIPRKLDKIRDELQQIFIETRDVLDLVERIRILSSTRKVE